MSAFMRLRSSYAFGGWNVAVERMVVSLYDLSILVRASFMLTSLSVANLIRDDSSRYAVQSLESEVWSGLEQLMHFCEQIVVWSWDSPHFLHLLSLLVQWFLVCPILLHFLHWYGLG